MPRDGAWDKEMRGKKALKSPTIVERWFVVVFAVSPRTWLPCPVYHTGMHPC